MKQINQTDHINIDVPMQRMERQAWVEMPLPDLKSFDRFIGWAIGRLLLGSGLFTVCTTKLVLNAGIYCCNWLEGGIKKVMQTYDALPFMGVPLQSVVVDTTSKAIAPDVSTVDLLEAIKGKHLLIIGDTGTGKSTIAQWIAASVGGAVRVYDADAAPDEWTGLEVIGRGGDMSAIEEAMSADLEELERRIKLRGEKGDIALAGMDSVTIGEEFPLLADEIDIAPNWMIKHGRRGRKPKRLLILLSQDDSVKALHIEGEGGVRKNFRYLRLGKFAVTHAKSLKDEALVTWLQSGKYRALVDDEPCQLPNLSGYQPVTRQLPQTHQIAPVVTAQTPAQSDFQPILTAIEPNLEALKIAVGLLKSQGVADSVIIKQVLGCQGSRYQQGKEILAELTKDS